MHKITSSRLAGLTSFGKYTESTTTRNTSTSAGWCMNYISLRKPEPQKIMILANKL